MTGQRFLCQRGEDQLADLAVDEHCAGVRIDDLRQEVVFPDHGSILGFDALAGNAWPDHL